MGRKQRHNFLMISTIDLWRRIDDLRGIKEPYIDVFSLFAFLIKAILGEVE